MAKKWVQFDGKKWVVVGSEGGGGTGHTHPNLSLLNSITQAMVTSWNTASTWVTTNGANVLSHIADSLLHVPSGGTAGQVLTKTATGTAWATGGGGSSGNLLQYIGAYSVRSNTTATFAPPTGATGLVLLVTYSNVRYATFIPIGELTTSYTEFGISCSNTYVPVRLKNDNGVVSMTRSSTSAYNITVYAI